MLVNLLIPLTLAAASLARPRPFTSSCDISNAQINLPTTSPTLAPPTSHPSFIALSIGTQNYTCTSAGTYANIGAVAELFDLSCLYKTKFQEAAYTLWKAAPAYVTPQMIIDLLHDSNSPNILGQHYIIKNPITGIGGVPKWDFSSQGEHNPDAWVLAAPAAGMPAPTGTQDVPWIALNNIQGALADQVYRVDTKGGQPANTTCTPGSPVITVRYSAKYWLFGGSIKQ
ncbi:hypothetical protein BDZ94DRAFT_997925 [Collybia nuda]|uniref:Malate dehydrogenase n=1 Tax=Collybia nuda TaxID=64659 RepID=A0A9P5XXP5_9AGAR|nr:hypothetical protein BDZ94DRAFT_997925 [Collybia nuda]